MSALITTTKKYRLYVILNNYKHYANRSATLRFPRVAWLTKLEELFPDHFTQDEMHSICICYSDQDVKVEECWVNDEDE